MTDYFDIRVLSFVCGIVAITLAGCMLFVVSAQKVYPGFSRWTIASLLNGIGLISLSLRHVLPDFLTIVVANSLIIVFFVLIARGLIEFVGGKQKTLLDIAPIVIITTTFLYFTYALPHVSARVVIFSLLTSFLCWRIALIIYKQVPLILSGTNWFLLMSFVIYGGWFFIRTILTLIFENQIEDFMSASALQGFGFIVIFVGNITIMTGFITINAQRLEYNLVETNDRLSQANDSINQVNSRLLTEIAEREEAQAQVIEQQRIMAALEERERLGRDLHDGLGQVMGYLNVQAQAIHTQLNDGHLDSARHNLLDLSEAAQEAHRDIRAHILGLRPAETPRQDFLTTVDNYIRQFSRHYHLPTTFNVPPDFPPDPFTPAVEEQALRILQEGLTNIRRHAQAKAVTVSFRESRGAVELEIVDDGIGFDPAATPEGHFGLEIMRERAEQVGGKLAIITAPKQGTRLVISLPRVLPPQSGDDLADIKGLRLLLVDDHPMFLDGLRNLLLARGLTVIGLANSGPEAVQKTRDLRPDVVVMDMNMPGGDGLEATRAIKAEFPAVKVVILTMAEDDDALYQAIESGAAGFLLKNMEANQFCELLAGLMRDEAALDPRLTGRLLSKFAEMSAAPSLSPADEVPLTEQQWEILGLVAAGMTYKEISTQIHLSRKTVQYHMTQILQKLQFDSRAQAIQWYQQRSSSI